MEIMGGNVTEEELLKRPYITPEDVLMLPSITLGYLCAPEANIYDIEFLRFKIRDMDSGVVLFEISKPGRVLEGLPSVGTSGSRYVRYQFTPHFLELKTVGATIEFRVGSRPITNFRMIERHYFRDRLLESFDFEFGFCIPNSCNSCEHIYKFPHLPPHLIKEMIKNPYETRSDSFYFVNNQLIMHNKADYAYTAVPEHP
ncbi:protein unc-119 isoform X2 [Cimex lectularius]|uniref:GMP phosphodiesterase delta subunit domain-containing protein n=1 Tax=Cimex lectularius TaxID=79782 RepID=A0A8I6RH46_CIMLE|nr:protein unc-119 isoform X2 [Cimex lectularius]